MTPSSTDLPEGWQLTTMLEACDLNPPKPRVGEVDDDTPVTFVPMPAVDADAGAITKPQVRPYSEVRRGFTSFRNEDVIIAKITPRFENGKAAICRRLENGIGFGSTEFHVLRSKGAVLPEYVYHFARQESFRRDGADNMTGSVGQKRVPPDWIGKVELPIPPFAEQRRIVAKVEELLARVNVARERLAKVPAILKRFRQSVLAAACDGRLTADWREKNRNVTPGVARKMQLLTEREKLWAKTTTSTRVYKAPYEVSGEGPFELPSSWCWGTVSHFCIQDVGFAFKSAEFAESGIRLLRGENVEPGALRWSETRFWPKSQLGEFKHLLIEEGDIILAMDRPVISTGLKIARAKSSDLPCLLVQRVMRFRMVKRESTAFLYRRLQHADFISFLTHEGMTGSDLPHITGTGVAEFPVPIIPWEEELEISRRVESLFALADKIEARTQAATARVEKITQAILAKAFRGELVPTEAELAQQEVRDYEPASVLLERIRAEREAAPRTNGQAKRKTTPVKDANGALITGKTPRKRARA